MISWLNSRPNDASYHFISRNCADFVREVLNFYYPKSESRGKIGDLFVSTPKHVAKSLVRYSKRHSDLEFSHFVIPQVPGTVKRSKPVRGVVESVFRAKKYAAALAVFHPFVAGGVASVYLVGDRFNPARSSPVLNLTGEAEASPTTGEKRAYQNGLKSLAGGDKDGNTRISDTTWRKFLQKAQPKFDEEGQAALVVADDEGSVELGITRDSLARDGAPLELERKLMLARLRQSLAHSRTPRTSSRELQEDWQLLEKIDNAERAQFSGRPDGENQAVSQGSGRTSN